MGLHHRDLPAEVLGALRRGAVIPAHPLALNQKRELDLRRQRALSRYYIDAGVSGLAVGVHTTQFAIREAGLYEPVLRAAAETATERADRALFLVAGLVGRTAQALRRGRDRARSRLSRRAAQPRRAQGRIRGRADRPLHGGRPAHSGNWLLSAAGGRRHRPAGLVLAPLRRDRQRDRDQDRALQPLSHPGRHPGRGRGGRRGADHAAHRQRRSHRPRPADAISLPPR